MRLMAFEDSEKPIPRADGPAMGFHVLKTLCAEHKLDEPLFTITGNVILPNIYASRIVAAMFR